MFLFLITSRLRSLDAYFNSFRFGFLKTDKFVVIPMYSLNLNKYLL